MFHHLPFQIKIHPKVISNTGQTTKALLTNQKQIILLKLNLSAMWFTGGCTGVHVQGLQMTQLDWYIQGVPIKLPLWNFSSFLGVRLVVLVVIVVLSCTRWFQSVS